MMLDRSPDENIYPPVTPACRGGSHAFCLRPDCMCHCHEREDPEEFCSNCFAGTESSEHHEKCIRPQEIRDDLRAWLLAHLSGRHVKLYGGSEGLLHHDSVDEIIEGLLRDAD